MHSQESYGHQTKSAGNLISRRAALDINIVGFLLTPMLLVATLAYRHNYITCEEGLYNLDEKYCVTVEECEAYTSYHKAYKELKMCLWVGKNYLSPEN